MTGHLNLVGTGDRAQVLGLPDVARFDASFETEFVEIHLHIQWAMLPVKEPDGL